MLTEDVHLVNSTMVPLILVLTIVIPTMVTGILEDVCKVILYIIKSIKDHKFYGSLGKCT